MTDRCLNIQLAQFSDSQLQEFREEIDRILLGRQGHSYSTNYASPAQDYNSDRDTFCSSAPTLHQSGRSTPHSISSDKAAAFETTSLYASDIQQSEALPFHPRRSDDNSLWPTLPAPNRRIYSQTSLRQKTLRGQTDQLSLTTLPTTNATIKVPRSSGAVKLPFPCTFCAEENVEKLIRTKQDWKRHEQDYHYGTGQEWECRNPNCAERFQRGIDFKKHCDRNHGDQAEPQKNKVILQHERVYACGFEICNALNYNWKDHCDHVATCIQKGVSVWNYSRTIRNLVKEPNVSATWKSVYSRLSPKVDIIPFRLQWSPDTTRHMREQLEYQDFGPSMQNFLERLFYEGLPINGTSPLADNSIPQPTFPPLPSTDPNGTQSMATSEETFDRPELEPPVAQLDLQFGSAGQMNNVDQIYMPGYRNSVAMPDAPSFFLEPQTSPQEGTQGAGTAGQELLSLQDFLSNPSSFSVNNTPPLDSAQDVVPEPGTRWSPSKRSIMRKSKEWLKPKRSQHFQHPITIEHPDVPPNTRMPTSSPYKQVSWSPRTPAADRL